MKALSLLGLGCFVVVSALVGVRVLLLWRRTRRLPELVLAIALFFIGFLGFAVSMISRLLLDPTAHVRYWGASIGLVSEYVGSAALAVFAWRVFHPRERWSAALFIALLAVVAASMSGELISREHLHYIDGSAISGPYVPIGLTVRGLGPLWATIVSFRYYGMLRRRLKLGLAEPLVVNRFALWGTTTTGTCIGYAISTVHRSVYGTGLQAHAWALNSVSLAAFVSASCVFLAFFPPKAYRRWVNSRADSADG